MIKSVPNGTRKNKQTTAKKPLRNIRPTRYEDTGSGWDGLVSEKCHGKTKVVFCLFLGFISFSCESDIFLVFNKMMYYFRSCTQMIAKQGLKTWSQYHIKKIVKSIQELPISFKIWGLLTVKIMNFMSTELSTHIFKLKNKMDIDNSHCFCYNWFWSWNFSCDLGLQCLISTHLTCEVTV